MKLDVKINSKSLCDEIGLKIISIKGREQLSKEHDYTDIKGVHGAKNYSSSYPVREIEIRYQMLRTANQAYRIAHSRLNGFLDQDDMQLIFNDEPDKYFVASKAECSDAVIKFICFDPYKYSVTEKEILPTEDSSSGTLGFQIENNGIIPVPIRIEATFNDRNSYLTAYSSGMNFDDMSVAGDGGTIELGNKTELDKVKVRKTQTTLTYQDFLNDTAIKTTSPGPTLAADYLEWHYPHATKTVDEFGDTWLYNGDEGAHAGNWMCGALKRLPIKTDAEGKTETKDWTLYAKHWFETRAMGQCSEQEIAVYTADDKLIARFRIWKSDSSGNTGVVSFQWHYGTIRNFEFTPSWDSPYGGHNGSPTGHNRITKQDDWVEFYFNGKNYRFSDSRLADMKAAKVQIAFADHIGERPVTINRMCNVNFDSYNVLTDQDVETVFKPGSKIRIDGSEGKSYVNGEYRPDLEILGSNYLKAFPGSNLAFIEPSRYVEDGSYTAKMYIREAWL